MNNSIQSPVITKFALVLKFQEEEAGGFILNQHSDTRFFYSIHER